MNFKKYHVSKNLLNEAEPPQQIYVTATVTRYGYEVSLPSGTYTVSGGDNTTFTKTKVGTTYATAMDLSTARTLILEENGYILIYAQTANKFDSINVMVNTGSQPLPYEPYGTEVWHDTPHYIMGTDTDTITTPAVLYANDTTATVGLKGQTVQSSIPSPTSPIMPNGTGEGTGNLFDKSKFALVQVTSTAYRYGTSLGVLPQGIYTFNATKSAGAQSIYLTAKLNGVFSQTTISTVPFTFTADGESEYIIRTANNTGTTWEAEKYSNIMLNPGSTALPYEPYGYKIPISSNNTTTPVYLGEVETTRKIRKFVLTGEEDWKILSTDSSKHYLTEISPDYMRMENAITYICSHYSAFPQTNSATSVPNLQMSMAYSTTAQRLYIADTNYTTVADFNAYLAAQYAAGTPVTVWYVLATPETGIVNEPLMKIGDYADTLSNISIPVTAGGDTLSVDTTVQPSEVTVNYKGWHPVQSAHERENGQWD